MAEQIYCELSDCVYHDEDEIHLGEPDFPASNCRNPNVKLWDDTRKACPFYRLDWQKKQAGS